MKKEKLNNQKLRILNDQVNENLVIIDGLPLLYLVFEKLGFHRYLQTSLKPLFAFKKLKEQLTYFVNESIKDFSKNICVSFDVSVDTFRRERYPEYKLTELTEFETDLKSYYDLKYFKKIFQSLGVEVINAPFGYESDDVIATLVNKAKRYFSLVFIFTVDSDLLQLVDESTQVCIMWANKQKIAYRVHNMNNFRLLNNGLLPSQILDYKSTVGDKSDNIKGFWTKEYAIEKLIQFGSFKKIIEQNYNQEINDMYNFNRSIIELKNDLDLTLPWKIK